MTTPTLPAGLTIEELADAYQKGAWALNEKGEIISTDHAKGLSAVAQHVAKAVEPKWVPVSERPKKSAYFPVLVEGVEQPELEWYDVDSDEWDDYDVTHWMPLPEPPKIIGNYPL